MEISQTADQIRALTRLQANCELQNVGLLSVSAWRAKGGTQLRGPYNAKPTISNITPFHHGKLLIIEVAFEYQAWDSSDPPERLFCVNCAFEASYQIRAGYSPTKEETDSFSRGTAVFNCWPYAREFLRDVTARLGHPAPPLPLLRIIPKRQAPSEVSRFSRNGRADVPQ